MEEYLTNRKRRPEYTRSREYKKNDNAHIEGRNWTHIRQYLGYERFDNPAVVPLLNDLYANEYSLLVNFFLPSVKLQEKERIGSKIIKRHDKLKRILRECSLRPRDLGIQPSGKRAPLVKSKGTPIRHSPKQHRQLLPGVQRATKNITQQ
jgi:hypothetical protein